MSMQYRLKIDDIGVIQTTKKTIQEFIQKKVKSEGKKKKKKNTNRQRVHPHVDQIDSNDNKHG